MSDINKTQDSSEIQTKKRGLFYGLGIVVICLIALCILGLLFLNKPSQIIEGQAEATSVRISGKLPGRVVDFYVSEGQNVKQGDTLVHIHSSLFEAQLYQAQAMEASSAAQNQKIDRGTRKQIIQSAYEILQQAIAARQIAEKTYNRMENLFKEGVVSEQKRDEAKAAHQATVAGEAAARSQYELAKAGAQREDKESAAALVDVAKGGVRAVEAVLEDQYLMAPCDGQVEEIYPEIGELVSLGAPIMTLLKMQDKWVTFNVREDYLNDMKMGKEIDIMIPALDKKKTKAKIFYINDLGTYAIWRATKPSGQWDSRTFEVKARPTEELPDLRPGMTVIYDLPE